MHPSWKERLSDELEKPYIEHIKKTLIEEYEEQKVYPPKNQIFRALEITSFEKVKVVIIGQDPYHGAGQANGLAFAVNEDQVMPPSLKNIFKEIKNEFGEAPNSSSLEGWADQGVLLLNASLTVRHKAPASHNKIGWHKFTDAIISSLSDGEELVVFMLWGNFARSKKSLIDTRRHLVLESVHPSPLSASRGFFGCNHFEKANKWLKNRNKEPIDWIKS